MTAAVFTGLYLLALLSQMYVISIYLPGRVVAAAGGQQLREIDDPRKGRHRF